MGECARTRLNDIPIGLFDISRAMCKKNHAGRHEEHARTHAIAEEGVEETCCLIYLCLCVCARALFFFLTVCGRAHMHTRGRFRKAYFKLFCFGTERRGVGVGGGTGPGSVRPPTDRTCARPLAWLPGLSFLPRNHYADRKLPFYR